MVHINSAQRTNQTGSGPWHSWLWLAALVVLPFASYLSLAILVGLILVAVSQRYRTIGNILWQQGYGLLTLALLISACFAKNPGDAWLQLANFLPYFLLVGVLASTPNLKNSTTGLSTIAQAIVLTSLVFSSAAVIEYIVRFPDITARVGDWQIFRWVFDVSFEGHRAHAGLSHPNILSNYFTIVLGLGLGLLIAQLRSAPRMPIKLTRLIALATVMAVIGNFCTGSRNGLVAAVVLLLISGYLVRHHRWVWMTGLSLLSAMVIGLLIFGVGGRSLSLDLFTHDPRIMAWSSAIDLIRQRPLTGWGLGGFSHQYVPFSVPNHERLFHPHNLWLYLACDVGIPTMVMFCWVVGRTYAAGLHRLIVANDSPVLLSYILAFTGCMLFGLFDVTLFDARINVLSWFMLASIGVLVSKHHLHSGETRSKLKQP